MRRSLTKRRDGRDVGLVGRRTARSGEKQTRGPIQRQQPSKPADEQMKPNNRATEQPSHRSNAQRQANPTNPNQSQPTQTNPNPNPNPNQSKPKPNPIPINPNQSQASPSKPKQAISQSQPIPTQTQTQTQSKPCFNHRRDVSSPQDRQLSQQASTGPTQNTDPIPDWRRARLPGPLSRSRVTTQGSHDPHRVGWQLPQAPPASSTRRSRPQAVGDRRAARCSPSGEQPRDGDDR
jgi:hypothetical protein